MNEDRFILYDQIIANATAQLIQSNKNSNFITLECYRNSDPGHKCVARIALIATQYTGKKVALNCSMPKYLWYWLTDKWIRKNTVRIERTGTVVDEFILRSILSAGTVDLQIFDNIYNEYYRPRKKGKNV